MADRVTKMEEKILSLEIEDLELVHYKRRWNLHLPILPEEEVKMKVIYICQNVGYKEKFL